MGLNDHSISWLNAAKDAVLGSSSRTVNLFNEDSADIPQAPKLHVNPKKAGSDRPASVFRQVSHICGLSFSTV